MAHPTTHVLAVDSINHTPDTQHNPIKMTAPGGNSLVTLVSFWLLDFSSKCISNPDGRASPRTREHNMHTNQHCARGLSSGKGRASRGSPAVHRAGLDNTMCALLARYPTVLAVKPQWTAEHRTPPRPMPMASK